MIDGEKHKSNMTSSYFVWSLAVFFFIYQFTSRLAPGLISCELMQHFNVNAQEFSKLSSSYYMAYALMQIPMGILIDRFGPRYIIFIMSLLCALSNYVFISTSDIDVAIICRGLMGFASVAGFIGSAKVISIYFHEKHHDRMIAMTFSIGFSGAFLSGQPLSKLMSSFGWENVMKVNSLIGIIIAFLILFFISNSTPYQKSKKKFSFSDLYIIIKDRKIILTTIAALLASAAYTAFADVWGIAFFNNAYEITIDKASLIISNIYLGMCFGGVILGYFSSKFNRYVVAATASFFISVIMMLVLYRVFSSHLILSIMMFMVGALCGLQVVIFIIVGSIVPSRLYGLATSVTNTMIMSSGMVFHKIIGFLIEYYYDINEIIIAHDKTIMGMNRYNSDEFVNALVSIPIAALIATLMLLFFSKQKT